MVKFTLSIKWLFLIVTITLVTVITITNYLLSFYLYKQYLIHHTDTVASLFKGETENFIKPVETFLYNIQALVCCKILNFNDTEKTNKFLMDFMKKYPYVTSINYGDGKGNGYLILNDRGRWLNRIKKHQEHGYVTWNTLGNDGRIINQKRAKDDYDPRETVWYKQAVDSHDIKWSKEYVFRTTKDPGITASLLLCSELQEVVGIDLMIKDISLFLYNAKQHLHPEVRLYLISDGQDVIAFVDDIAPEPGKIYQLDAKEFPLLYNALITKKDENFYKIDYQNQKWFVNIKNWKIKNRELSIVVFIPQTVITKNLQLYLFYQIFVSLIFTFIVLIYITMRYIEPIMEISRQTVNLGFKEIYLEKYSQRTDEIGYLSRAISDASLKILEAKKIERKMEETHYFDSVRRSLGEAVHRFKDLINVILGFATIAQSKVSNEFAKNALDQIINASKKTLYLIKEIINVTDERKYDMKTVNLNSIILSMKTKIQAIASDSIKIIYEIVETSIPVNLDIEAFDEVIINLISNATDAMPEGGTLTIKTETASFLNKEFAVLSISDTGVGMDEETQKKIFEPFFTTKGAKGTGLGLPIVYRIIRDHDGFIEVKSEVGKGTTFTIYFPLIKDVTKLKTSSTE